MSIAMHVPNLAQYEDGLGAPCKRCGRYIGSPEWAREVCMADSPFRLSIAQKDGIQGGRLVTFRRVECSCGWASEWFTTFLALTRSMNAHRHEEERHDVA
jgi:hypothetical protein